MKIAKIFYNGRSQAVRLPIEFRFNGNQVQIKKDGNNVILIPMDNSWDSLVESLNEFSDDFMEERISPSIDKREDLF